MARAFKPTAIRMSHHSLNRLNRGDAAPDGLGERVGCLVELAARFTRDEVFVPARSAGLSPRNVTISRARQSSRVRAG